MKHAPRLAILALIAFGATGCSHQAPVMEIGQAELAEATPTGVLVNIPLLAHNPNDVDLDLFDIHYALSLDGQVVFDGVRSAEAALVRRGTQRIVLPVAIPTSKLPSRGVANYTVSGDIAYQTPAPFSETLYEAGWSRPTSSFQGEGSVDLAATPPPPPAPATLDPATTPATAPSSTGTPNPSGKP